MRLEVIFLAKKQRELEKELYKKEVVYNFLKEKEQEGSLTNKQKIVLKNIDKYLKKLNNFLVMSRTRLRVNPHSIVA